ncbi:MAG TPA: efflux RND transporter periplasmic adaptor subunit, partial [Gemmataceae bacterium]|nr:efflux RND transporter periplasmic adaptor subunit [Gemmataceae bacterium]
LKTVDIRARVSGFIMEAPFNEGDLVHEGDLLFQIDRRPYQAALDQAEANVKVAVADQNLQLRNSQRAHKMIQSNSIAREDYDTMLATEEKSRATVGAVEAARDLARLNLDYTRVIAPLSGRISRRFVDPGNLITADTTVLTSIVSDNQLYAYFDVDERTYLDLLASAKQGQGSWLAGLRFPVLMSLANEGNKFEHVGKVNFIDNRVNATTGTIRMRAVFDNADGFLKSGLFVRIRLPIGNPYHTLLVAAEALLSDQGRSYVYVVDDKNQVAYRRVNVGQELEGLRVIKDGLAEGERVIVSGMQRVRPGTEVEVKMQPRPKAPESPLVRLLTQTMQADKEKGRGGEGERRKQQDNEKGSGSVPAGSED